MKIKETPYYVFPLWKNNHTATQAVVGYGSGLVGKPMPTKDAVKIVKWLTENTERVQIIVKRG